LGLEERYLITNMKDKLYQDGYLLIDDFLKPEEAKRFFGELLDTYHKYPNDFIKDGTCPKSLSIGDMWQFVELLVEKNSKIADIVGEPVFPTYSYARMYKRGEVLAKHIDRGACELSVTLHLGSDGVEWPIWMEKPNKEQVAISLKPGQAVLYLGCLTLHWRDMYEGDDYRQVFLHYVKARGENKKYYFDKRK